MTIIAAKPTLYRGVRFRSRLEARWAVFLTSLRVPWTYEPEIDGISGYVPDFDIGLCLMEVKPDSWTTVDPRWKELAVATNRDLYVVRGAPGKWEGGRLTGGIRRGLLFRGGTGDCSNDVVWTECATCGATALASVGDVPPCGCVQWHSKIMGAFYAVRDHSYEDA